MIDYSKSYGYPRSCTMCGGGTYGHGICSDCSVSLRVGRTVKQSGAASFRMKDGQFQSRTNGATRFSDADINAFDCTCDSCTPDDDEVTQEVPVTTNTSEPCDVCDNDLTTDVADVLCAACREINYARQAHNAMPAHVETCECESCFEDWAERQEGKHEVHSRPFTHTRRALIASAFLALIPATTHASTDDLPNPPKGCKRSTIDTYEDGSARVRCKDRQYAGFNPDTRTWSKKKPRTKLIGW